MKTLVLLTATLLIANFALATDNSAAWAQVMTKVRSHGTFDPGAEEFPPPSYRLQEVKGPISQSHSADYLSQWGYVDPQSQEFVGQMVTSVTEDWQLGKDQIWRIEQWLGQFSLDGRLQKMSHNLIVENLAAEVLDYQSESIDPTGAVAQQRVDTILEKWLKF